MDLYLAVDKEVHGALNVTLSGRYLCKVYEGPYKDTQKWMEDFNRYTEHEGYTVTKTYLWYTTCPKCAKVYGKNYVVVVAELNESTV